MLYRFYILKTEAISREKDFKLLKSDDNQLQSISSLMLHISQEIQLEKFIRTKTSHARKKIFFESYFKMLGTTKYALI